MMNTENAYPFGISLSGGGLSCLAYSGFCDELSKHRLIPNYYAGLSGGSLIAVLLASGLSSAEIKSFLLELLNPKLVNTHPHHLEVIDHRSLITELRRMLPHTYFEDLPKPALVITTDMTQKESVVIDTGDIASAVVASCSVYPVLQPVKRLGKLLGDGGFSAYYGAKYLRLRGAQKVIGVDVVGFSENNVPGLFSTFYKQLNAVINSNTKYELQTDPVDLNFVIRFPSPSVFEFKAKVDSVIMAGVESAEKNMRSIRKSLIIKN